jgi:hypothetical protein
VIMSGSFLCCNDDGLLDDEVYDQVFDD